ncbi:hypothetical protein RvY_11732, partial [Ramazzottius varieornatus]
LTDKDYHITMSYLLLMLRRTSGSCCPTRRRGGGGGGALPGSTGGAVLGTCRLVSLARFSPSATELNISNKQELTKLSSYQVCCADFCPSRSHARHYELVPALLFVPVRRMEADLVELAQSAVLHLPLPMDQPLLSSEVAQVELVAVLAVVLHSSQPARFVDWVWYPRTPTSYPGWHCPSLPLLT